MQPIEAELPALTDAELAVRVPVWTVLSDLFLDTDVSIFRERAARILADCPYSITQLERILIDEVTPACAFNLRDIAGEWACFPNLWLVQSIRKKRVAPMTGRKDHIMWNDWLALRSATEALRHGSSEQVAI